MTSRNPAIYSTNLSPVSTSKGSSNKESNNEGIGKNEGVSNNEGSDKINKELNENLKHIINDIAKFSSDVSIYNLEEISSIFKNIEEMDNITEERTKDSQDKIFLLKKYLTETFNTNMKFIKTEFDSIKKTEKFFLNVNNLKDKYEKTLKELKHEINLDNRKYEYNIGEYNKMVYEISLLRKFLIFTIALFIIPILRLLNIIDSSVSIILFFSILFLGICLITYLYYSNNTNRDNIFYNKLNYTKPKDKEVSSLNETCESEENKSHEKDEKIEKETKWNEFIKNLNNSKSNNNTELEPEHDQPIEQEELKI